MLFSIVSYLFYTFLGDLFLLLMSFYFFFFIKRKVASDNRVDITGIFFISISALQCRIKARIKTAGA